MNSSLLDENDVKKLRKNVKCLEQHNGLQLSDTIPSLFEVINTRTVNLSSLHTGSLIQIGLHALQAEKVTDRTTDVFISQLTNMLLDLIKNEEDEDAFSKYCFLLTVWFRKDSILLPDSAERKLDTDWKQYIHQMLSCLVIRTHTKNTTKSQHVSSLFDSAEAISFLNICRVSPLVFQESMSALSQFLIHLKGCEKILSIANELVKKVQYRCKDKLNLLFPPKYKNLIPHLQSSPASCLVDKEITLELLVTTFKQDKRGALTLVMCFPAWLSCLNEYYQLTYGGDFFIDFGFPGENRT